MPTPPTTSRPLPVASGVLKLTPDQARLCWHQAEPFIARGIRKMEMEPFSTAFDIGWGVASGKYDLWVAYSGSELDAAIACAIQTYDRCTAYNVFVGGGRNFKSWLAEFNQKVEMHARSLGCRFTMGGGRKGWVRAAGYRECGTMLFKELQ
jgi:hypothetical protein